MRKPIIAGNWKMNKTPAEAVELVKGLIPLVKDAKCDVVVCPTAVCLPAVAEVIKGTNIKLGAQNVLAIDIDPDAVKVAKENVELNHVTKQVRVVVGDLCKSEAMPCEVAVANIVADAICMLAGPMTRHLVKGGLLICSGIIREREADVQKAAKEAGYRQVDRIEKGEWVALCLKNEA